MQGINKRFVTRAGSTVLALDNVSVDIEANPTGLDCLHRDVVNITTWLARQGLERDPEDLFALLQRVGNDNCAHCAASTRGTVRKASRNRVTANSLQTVQIAV